MKTSAPTYPQFATPVDAAAVVAPLGPSSSRTIAAAPGVAAKSWLALGCELAKVRLTFLVVVTTLVGFVMGSPSRLDFALMAHAVLGTALLASGASALNQWSEWRLDALMRRTQERPLPSGRMRPGTAVVIGAGASLSGLVYLAAAVNGPTAWLGAATLGAYVLVYTPLKRVTTLNTVIGAIPGAMPPLMGWVAAQGGWSPAGWSLFAVQFFWQLPHFLAIAWLYREDYARAGFRMLPVVDPDGRQTGLQAVSHSLGLLTVSLAPFALRLAGAFYLAGALALGVAFLVLALRFSRRLDRAGARALFLGSIIYLPVLLGLMVWDKVG
jgi:protoheme IX farnesyltransferase